MTGDGRFFRLLVNRVSLAAPGSNTHRLACGTSLFEVSTKRVEPARTMPPGANSDAGHFRRRDEPVWPRATERRSGRGCRTSRSASCAAGLSCIESVAVCASETSDVRMRHSQNVRLATSLQQLGIAVGISACRISVRPPCVPELASSATAGGWSAIVSAGLRDESPPRRPERRLDCAATDPAVQGCRNSPGAESPALHSSITSPLRAAPMAKHWSTGGHSRPEVACSILNDGTVPSCLEAQVLGSPLRCRHADACGPRDRPGALGSRDSNPK